MVDWLPMCDRLPANGAMFCSLAVFALDADRGVGRRRQFYKLRTFRLPAVVSCGCLPLWCWPHYLALVGCLNGTPATILEAETIRLGR
jgi:hypothetical protein